MTNPTPRENYSANEPLGSQNGQVLTNHPAWLVSVRSVPESLLAAEYPVDIIDFKEPNHGALAPVDPAIWHQAVAAFESLHDRTLSDQVAITKRPRLSAALGEREDMMQVASAVPPRFTFAKVGPHRCDSATRLKQLWCQTQRQLPDCVELVAVAYADHVEAECLTPEEIFDIASDFGIKRCLIDTFRKDGRSTIDVLGIDRLAPLSFTTQQRQRWWALAGSITLNQITQLSSAQIEPDCIGVRGDVCDQSRTSSLSRERMQHWSSVVSQYESSSSLR